MKRLLVFPLLAALVVAACGGAGIPGLGGGGPKVGMVTDIGQLEDKSFDEFSWKGVQDGAKAVGGSAQAIVTKDTEGDNALAIQLARIHLMTGSRSALGGFFIDHALLGWPLYLLAIYLELFALLVAFRPALQRPWAICLITAHIVVYLTMRIDFMSQAFLLALLLFRSPFAPQGVAWRDVLRAVPLLGLLWWRRVPDHMRVRFRSCDPPASTVTLTNIST